MATVTVNSTEQAGESIIVDVSFGANATINDTVVTVNANVSSGQIIDSRAPRIQEDITFSPPAFGTIDREYEFDMSGVYGELSPNSDDVLITIIAEEPGSGSGGLDQEQYRFEYVPQSDSDLSLNDLEMACVDGPPAELGPSESFSVGIDVTWTGNTQFPSVRFKPTVGGVSLGETVRTVGGRGGGVQRFDMFVPDQVNVGDNPEVAVEAVRVTP
jgi:hypothetical protein